MNTPDLERQIDHALAASLPADIAQSVRDAVEWGASAADIAAAVEDAGAGPLLLAAAVAYAEALTRRRDAGRN